MQELGLKGEAGGGQKDKVERRSSRQREECVQRPRREHRPGRLAGECREGEAGISRGWGPGSGRGGD